MKPPLLLDYHKNEKTALNDGERFFHGLIEHFLCARFAAEDMDGEHAVIVTAKKMPKITGKVFTC